jgi:hypothetical protein
MMVPKMSWLLQMWMVKVFGMWMVAMDLYRTTSVVKAVVVDELSDVDTMTVVMRLWEQHPY